MKYQTGTTTIEITDKQTGEKTTYLFASKFPVGVSKKKAAEACGWCIAWLFKSDKGPLKGKKPPKNFAGYTIETIIDNHIPLDVFEAARGRGLIIYEDLEFFYMEHEFKWSSELDDKPMEQWTDEDYETYINDIKTNKLLMKAYLENAGVRNIFLQNLSPKHREVVEKIFSEAEKKKNDDFMADCINSVFGAPIVEQEADDNDDKGLGIRI